MILVGFLFPPYYEGHVVGDLALLTVKSVLLTKTLVEAVPRAGACACRLEQCALCFLHSGEAKP